MCFLRSFHCSTSNLHLLLTCKVRRRTHLGRNTHKMIFTCAPLVLQSPEGHLGTRDEPLHRRDSSDTLLYVLHMRQPRGIHGLHTGFHIQTSALANLDALPVDINFFATTDRFTEMLIWRRILSLQDKLVRKIPDTITAMLFWLATDSKSQPRLWQTLYGRFTL